MPRRGAPFPRIDLVVCRNLLIYFKPELQQAILNMFAYSLHDTHGFLFLGHAETVRPSQVNFELVNKKWKIYQSKYSNFLPPMKRQDSESWRLFPARNLSLAPKEVEKPVTGQEVKIDQEELIVLSEKDVLAKVQQ